MGEMGMAAVEKVLPGLRKERGVDLVIAQAENATAGRGLSIADYERLKAAGVDAMSGGNWTPYLPETAQLLDNVNYPVVGPANMPDCPGRGFKYVPSPAGQVLLISLLGHIVGRDADKEVGNPLKVVDKILADEAADKRVAAVVNLHGDYSSEKFIIGYYLDGRVSAVVGDHWHVPTADAEVLPKGTAHITDVGMCGSLDSSLGIKFDAVLPRWRDGYQTRNQLETTGRSQFNALLVNVNEATGKATSAEHIREVW
jgi:metallophosphoesterase (TIGR00282 family)